MRQLDPAYNLLTIKPTGNNSAGKDSKVFQAYIQNEVKIRMGVQYQTIFEDVINIRNKLNQLLAGVSVVSDKFLNKISENLSQQISAPFAQGIAWTRKFGGVPEYIDFNLDCVLINFDSEDDIFMALNDLYDMTIPKISTYVGQVPQMDVMIDIGGWLIFKDAFVTDIDHRFSKMSVNQVPLYVELSISFTTKYVVDRGMISGLSGRKIIIAEENRNETQSVFYE
jgi:hypothetical protein